MTSSLWIHVCALTISNKLQTTLARDTSLQFRAISIPLFLELGIFAVLLCTDPSLNEILKNIFSGLSRVSTHSVFTYYNTPSGSLAVFGSIFFISLLMLECRSGCFPDSYFRLVPVVFGYVNPR